VISLAWVRPCAAEQPDEPPAVDVMKRFNAVGLPAYVILKPRTEALDSGL
jgi:hypothetical protein